MNTLSKTDKRMARRLAEITVEHGEAGVAPVSAALKKLLAEKSPSYRKAFLKTYRRYLKREIALNTLIIEHAGPLGKEEIETIRASFTARTDRKLSVETRENPDLLGGLRVRHADNLYDSSLAGRLQRLAAGVE